MESGTMKNVFTTQDVQEYYVEVFGEDEVHSNQSKHKRSGNENFDDSGDLTGTSAKDVQEWRKRAKREVDNKEEVVRKVRFREDVKQI